MLWALARLGARQPLYGSLHTVISVEVVEDWIMSLLKNHKLPKESKIFPLTQLARKTSDRARNISEDTGQKVIDFFLQERETASGPGGKVSSSLLDSAIQSLREVSHYQTKEQNLIFGESLPKGLQLR